MALRCPQGPHIANDLMANNITQNRGYPRQCFRFVDEQSARSRDSTHTGSCVLARPFLETVDGQGGGAVDVPEQGIFVKYLVTPQK